MSSSLQPHIGQDALACPAGGNSPPAGHHSAFALLFIAPVLLGLTFAASAQTVIAQAKPPAKSPTSSEDAQLYRNLAFGFRYRIPYGWVDRTKDMQEGNDNDADKAGVLLAVFEHPPEVTSDTINSAVVIATESAGSYPGLKKAEDYIGPLAESVTAKGFKADGDPSIIDVEARQLVRADFSKPLSAILTMHQSTLVMLAKGQIVSFTFLAASEDELDDLMDGLHFTNAKPPVH